MLFAGLGCLTGALIPSASASPLYQVTKLGAIGAFGLDSSGRVLGGYTTSTREIPFVYNSYGPSAGQQIPIPLDGAVAMSGNGMVSGWVGAPASAIGTSNAEVYNVNTPNVPPTVIQGNLPGTTGVLATNLYTSGVNDAGQAVGQAWTLATPYNAHGNG
jgi:hypothetical protein